MIGKLEEIAKSRLLWVFLSYLALGIAYFYPAFSQSLLIAPGDSWVQNFPLRDYYADLLAGDFSFWLPYEFLGTSLIGIMQIGILYPPNLIYLFFPETIAFNLSLVGHYILGAMFTFLYIRSLGLRLAPAFISGIVLGFSGFLMAHKGHVSMMNAAVWLPLMLYLFEKLRSTLSYKYVGLASMIIAVQIFAGHFQISVYSLLFLGSFCVYHWFLLEQPKSNRFLLLAILTVVIGVVIASPQLIATKELSEDAWRVNLGYDYFVEYSFPPFMFLTFIFPFIFGGGYGGPYWGAWNLTELIGFVGVLPIIIGFTVFVNYFRVNIHVRFWGIAAIVVSIMAMGGSTPLYKPFYYLPVYNLFRAPARHWLEFNLAISVLFSFGLQYLFYDLNEKGKLLKKIFKVYLYFISLIVLLFLLGKSIFTASFPVDILTNEAKDMIIASFSLHNKAIWIPLIFIVGYLVWLILMKFSDQNKKALLLIVSVIVFLEAYSFGGFHDRDWTPFEKVENLDFVDGSLYYLQENAGLDRSFYLNDRSPHLFNVPLNLQKLNGYDPLINNNLHELLDMGPSGEAHNMEQLIKNNMILSMMNSKYIVSGGSWDLSFYHAKVNTEDQVKEDLIPLGDWQLSDAKISGKEMYLQSNKGNVSLIQQKISLEPNTDYVISLKAKNKQLTTFLVIDLFGEGYDNQSQELVVNPEKITNDVNEFKKVINTGQQLPGDVYLRVFTFSPEPIIVEDVKIAKLEGYKPSFIGNLKPEEIKAETVPLYEKVYDDQKGTQIYENRNAFPKVFAVRQLKEAENIQSIKKSLLEYEVNPRETAMVNPEDLDLIGQVRFADGDVRVTDYQNDKVAIQSDFREKGFIVLTDQYAPGWKAYINDKETKIFKVNGVLRGIVVPEGKHVIEFKYIPVSLYVSLVISLVISVALIIMLLINRIKKIKE